MINLFAWIPDQNDATSFYRGIQPIAQLRRHMPELNITYAGKEIGFKDLSHQNAIFLQRPCGMEHVALIEMARNLQVPVWVDYDDDLWNVPSSNPAIAIYGQERTKQALNEIVAKATVITVSTELLKLEIEKKTKTPVYVIPNAFNNYLFETIAAFKLSPTIMWRGSASHQADLLKFQGPIEDIAKKCPNRIFNFLGFNPWFITEGNAHQFLHYPPSDIFQYHRTIQFIRPNINIVTLTDNIFNACKSNISWIEGTFAGAVTLAPDLPEWRKPGIVTYKNVEEFGTRLYQLTQSLELETFRNDSKNYIFAELRLSKVNLLRKYVIDRITKCQTG